jgi:metallo-beta-lactamase class B
MKRLAALAFAVLALAAVAPAHAQANWNTPTEPFRIADNLWYVGTEGLGAYLFTSPEGHILLDGATPKAVPIIEVNILKAGFRLSDVKILLNSHAHFDHSGGLAALKAHTLAKLAAMEGDVSALEGGFYLGSEAVARFRAPPVKVDRVLKDGDTVTLGGWTLTANLTPGHTRGCTSWGFKATDQGEAYEALVFCSASVAANRIVPPLQYQGIVEDYRRTFARARTMKVDLFLAPHGEFFNMAEKRAKLAPGAPNPFVRPGEFQAFIAGQEAAFETTLAERSAGAN